MGCHSSSVKPKLEGKTSSISTTTSDETLAQNRRFIKLAKTKTQSPNGAQEKQQHFSTWFPTPVEPTDESNKLATNFVNVLLLGESGAGKSTFINALINYLSFDTLEQARSGKPIALMPVSFVMTVGDQFEERIVRFGGVDPNEDYNHPGQSVTQKCKSYVFAISSRTKLRLIDTPGMGDTRGLAQDDFNMKHILSFIDNLPHINAICILLKPNEAKLNVVFRSYFTRLLHFMGEDVRNNIVFCFTNTRATFFAPGDTGPLLKEMLSNFPIKHIPFKKTNTFCFDSESFRYLMARENGIEFDEYQKGEYQESWLKSVKESIGLLQYICDKLQPYPHTRWQSIENAQFQITQLIRPILETIRNILRNTILQKEKPSSRLIRLCPKILPRPSTICSKCKRTPQHHSDFYILPDDLHTFIDKCSSCECSRRRHIDVDYTLEYKVSNETHEQSVDEMKSDLDQLKQIIPEFGYVFLYDTGTSEPNDPVLSFLDQMIKEENQICDEKGTDCLNSILHKKLNQLKDEYKQRMNTIMSRKNPINLASIYEMIQRVSEIDLIREQLHVIKQYHQEYISEQEKQLL
jgi:GTP-binding protein EngB required for normal cell division